MAIQTYDEPSDAYDEDDGWFIGEYPAVMFDPNRKPAPVDNGSTVRKALNPEVSIHQTDPEMSIREDDGWFIGEYPAVMFDPNRKPAPFQNGSTVRKALNPEVSIHQTRADRSIHCAAAEPTQPAIVHRRSRNHLQGLQWATALWAMGLTTIVVGAAVWMWCYTGGNIDLDPYLDSGITTGTALALGAAVVWAFKSVVDDKKKKDDADS